MILFKPVKSGRLKDKTTPDSFKQGVESGASVYPDLGKLVKACEVRRFKGKWKIGVVDCEDDLVIPNPKSSHGGLKSNKYILFHEEYMDLDRIKVNYSNYIKDYVDW
jgi:hypothetical protein